MPVALTPLVVLRDVVERAETQPARGHDTRAARVSAPAITSHRMANRLVRMPCSAPAHRA